MKPNKDEWLAKRKGMGEEAIKHCRSYALEAERKMGRMLLETERADGGDATRARLPDVTEHPPTLSDLGLTKRESSDAQILATISDEEFAKVKSGERTKTDVKRETQRAKQKERIESICAVRDSEPQFNLKPELILADPPWKYDFSETETRAIENQYPTENVEELALHLPTTYPDCLLLLWATAPKLREAMKLMQLWGFTYKTHAIWDKKIIGMGYWFRGRHELLLIGTKGNISPPLKAFRRSSVFEEQRSGHSKKPECVYAWIEEAFPHLAKLEMYARSVRPGWMAWGNEV